jgi:PadR family transcriptional regulator, regulatory protein PadR
MSILPQFNHRAHVTQIELLILTALSLEPAHGYALALRVAELSGGRIEVRPGNLYRVLDRLVRRGWAREAAETGSGAGDDRRRTFVLTPAGRRAAAAELRMYADIMARAPDLGRSHG